MRERMKSWMMVLIYPAFLGTFLVEFSRGVELDPALPWEAYNPLNWGWDQSRWHGLLMLLYFGSLFVETEVIEGPNYNFKMLLLDVVEVGLMFLVFQFLGFSATGAVYLRAYYITAMALFATSIVWKWWIYGLTRDTLTILAILAIGTSLLGLIFACTQDRHVLPVTITLWVLMAVYVGYLVNRALKSGAPGSPASVRLDT